MRFIGRLQKCFIHYPMAEKLIWQGWKVSLKLENMGKQVRLLKIKDKYHYSDWSEVKIRLSKLRDDIVTQWEKVQKK